MTRALTTFSVCYAGCRLRVRVLPGVRDVDREYRGGRRRQPELCVHAYFDGATRSGARHTGAITLGGDARLEEIVPHEVTHAVMHLLRRVDRADDERLATMIGILSARILAKIRAKVDCP